MVGLVVAAVAERERAASAFPMTPGVGWLPKRERLLYRVSSHTRKAKTIVCQSADRCLTTGGHRTTVAVMRLTNVRQFIRGGYLEPGEPVQVIRGTEVLGVWHPSIAGVPSVEAKASPPPPVVVPELAATPEPSVRAGNGSVAGTYVSPIRGLSKADQAKGKRA